MVAALQGLKCRLREDFVTPFLGGERNVDEANGVIRNVRIQGFFSRNRRHYLRETLEDALPLYQGKFVYFRKHTKNPNESYDPVDKIGWVDNCRLTEDGIYGDLHLLLNHEHTARVLEAAKRNPRMYALSHDADGELTSADSNGYKRVTKINEVFALDLVDRGGSNDSLFEDFNMATTNLRKLIEADLRMPVDVKKRLLEDANPLDQEIPMMGSPMESPVQSPAPGADAKPEEVDKDWREHFAMMISQLIKNGDPAAHKFAVKAMALLHDTGQSPVPGEEKPAMPESKPEFGKGKEEGKDDGKDEKSKEAVIKEEEEDDNLDEGCDPMKMQEELDTSRANEKRLTEELDSLKLRDWIREECEKHKVPATVKLVNRLSLMRDKAAITEHLQEDLKGLRRQPVDLRPRSGGQPPASRDEVKKPSEMDDKEFVGTLNNGRI